MSLTGQALTGCYVVSASKQVERTASQLYFAALLNQRAIVGARLLIALRRLRTIAGPDDFDHLRVARYPRAGSLAALRCSPMLLALSPLQRRGVADLQMSIGSHRGTPRDWRQVGAAWVLTDRDQDRPRALSELLLRRPELGCFCAFEAFLSPLPPHPLTGTVPHPLRARWLSVLAFPSVRLALDALSLPDVTRLRETSAGTDSDPGGLGWAVMERVSLREMLTPR